MELPRWPMAMVEFLSFSPVFKGWGLLLLGGIGALIAYLFRARSGPTEIGWRIFLAVSVFLCALGIYVLIMRPDWWPNIAE